MVNDATTYKTEGLNDEDGGFRGWRENLRPRIDIVEDSMRACNALTAHQAIEDGIVCKHM